MTEQFQMMCDPVKSNKAHSKVNQALLDGVLVRPDTCELCGVTYAKGTYYGREKIVAHHWNGYDEPLNVWWICVSCNCLLRDRKFHTGSVSKEQAREIIRIKHNTTKSPFRLITLD